MYILDRPTPTLCRLEPMSLLDLSPELLLHIFSYLNHLDLAACRRVNRGVGRLIRSSALLQYHAELEVAGYEDNPHCALPIADRLRLLRNRERAWARLDFDKYATLRIPFQPSSIYDLTDSILLLGESTSGIQSGADAVRWTRLTAFGDHTTSEDCPEGCHSWAKIDAGAHIIDVGLSVHEHDLIVIATSRESEVQGRTKFELRLVQISTGLQHPLAKQPVIGLEEVARIPRQIIGLCSVCIEVIGDYLCILFHYPPFTTDPPAVFEVFNWKEGRHLLTRGLQSPTYSTFSFLSHNLVALPNCTSNTIELCFIDSPHPEPNRPANQLRTACIVELPVFSPDHSIAQVTCRSEPKAAAPPSTIAPAFRRNVTPFFLRPDNAIIIFNLMTHDRFGFHECLTLIAHQASLLALLPPGRPNDDTLPTTVSWAEWGPGVCRWLETSFSASRWITTTCGQRYVTIEEEAATEDEPAPCHILVYDFNPYNVRRLAKKHELAPCDYRDIAVQADASTAPPYPPIMGPSLDGSVTYADVGVQVDLFDEFGNLEDNVEGVPKEVTTFVDPKTQAMGWLQVEATELTTGITSEYKVFNDPVISALPFVGARSDTVYNYGAVLLDEDKVIGIKLDDHDDIKELIIHRIRTSDEPPEHSRGTPALRAEVLARLAQLPVIPVSVAAVGTESPPGMEDLEM